MHPQELICQTEKFMKGKSSARIGTGVRPLHFDELARWEMYG